jgi:signal transduction histidine kinase
MGVLAEIMRQKDSEPLFRFVVRSVPDLVGAKQCSLFERVGSRLILRATNCQSKGEGRMAGDLVGRDVYDVGEGFTGWVAEQALPLRIRHVALSDSEVPAILEAYASAGRPGLPSPQWSGGKCHDGEEDRQFMGVPIMQGDSCCGVLRVSLIKSAEDVQEFDDYNLLLLLTIATQIGSAIEALKHKKGRIHAITAVRALLHQLAVLSRSYDGRRYPETGLYEATAMSATRLIPGKNTCAFVRTYDPDKRKLVLRAIAGEAPIVHMVPSSIGVTARTGGLSGAAFAKKEAIICNDVRDPDNQYSALQRDRAEAAHLAKDNSLESYYGWVRAIAVAPLYLGGQESPGGSSSSDAAEVSLGDPDLPRGVLVIVSGEENVFDMDMDEQALKLFGRMCALSIDLAKMGRDMLAVDQRVWTEIAHEVRHKLRNRLKILEALRNSLQLIINESDLPPEVKREISEELVRELTLSGYEMERVLQQLQIGSGEPDSRSVSLRSVLGDALRMFRQAYPSIEFRYEATAFDVAVTADESKVIEVFNELLSNAVKAVGEHGRIRVWTEVHGGEVHGASDDTRFVTIGIEDSGPGVAEENLQRIFKRGFTTDTVQGEGLGLAFVRDHVEGWGGSVDFKNLALGGMAVVNLPVSSPEARKERDEVSHSNR